MIRFQKFWFEAGLRMGEGINRNIFSQNFCWAWRLCMTEIEGQKAVCVITKFPGNSCSMQSRRGVCRQCQVGSGGTVGMAWLPLQHNPGLLWLLRSRRGWRRKSWRGWLCRVVWSVMLLTSPGTENDLLFLSDTREDWSWRMYGLRVGRWFRKGGTWLENKLSHTELCFFQIRLVDDL